MPAGRLMDQPRDLFSHRPHWAVSLGPAPVLPTSRAEMDALGWDRCDVIIVSGDAYVDHPSFGMALVGRLLEAHGFRVGVLSQPDWTDPESFMALGKPELYFGVTGGNMDSMVNRYTSDRKVRRDDAYTAGGEGGSRPDRSVIVYAQRCRQVYRDVPVVIGGIESSLRRIAHYDYWSDKVRRSVLLDAKADLLLYGNAERAVVELTHRLARGESIDDIRDLRGTAFVVKGPREGYAEVDSETIDTPGPIDPHPDPYAMSGSGKSSATPSGPPVVALRRRKIAALKHPRDRTVIRMPSFEAVRDDPVLYAHASRLLHLESNPGNARAPGPGSTATAMCGSTLRRVPLSTEEMDRVYELPYTRLPHPGYGGRRRSPLTT